MAQINLDVLIIGAGPSGCVAASYLHNQGFAVKVVEKNQFPRFVIGESLLPRCMDHLEETGLLEPLTQMDFEIKKGARFLKNGVVCHFDFSKKHTKGWDWTWQVPRADFDKVLTDTLQERGVNIAFGCTVTDVAFNNEGCTTTLQDENGDGRQVLSKYIIDCSGYGRVLPRLLQLDMQPHDHDSTSVFTHVIDSKRPPGEEGTLITFDIVRDDTWLWVIPFSNGNTSIGFVGPSHFLESYEGSSEEMLRNLMELSDHYVDRFDGVSFLFEPKQIKNYTQSVNQMYGPRYAITGNSAGFLDPVFSSGVTFATESGLLAAKLFSKELRGEKVDWEVEYAQYMNQGIDVFSTYVKEWYTVNLQKLFFHRPENPDIKRQICAVLAGYVWDRTNPFVKNHHRLIKTVAKVIELEEESHLGQSSS
ncbi:MAG: NAD(P)/FAD-dependent oxidoreductase [Flavobacteriaceae bacterium]